MKRYAFTDDPAMEPDEHGRWVLYEEVEVLLVELNLLRGEKLRAADVRHAALEQAALVLDRIVAAMAAHTNQDGMVTGEDFHHPEIDYIRDAAIRIRALKTTP